MVLGAVRESPTLSKHGLRRPANNDAAVVDGRNREAGFVHHLKVGLNGLLDRLALGGEAWELGPEDAEGAFGLRLQHDLVLALNAHVVKLARP